MLCGRRMVVAFDSILGFDLKQVELVARVREIPFDSALPYLEVVEDEYLKVVKQKKPKGTPHG